MAELVATVLWNIGGAVAADTAIFLAANAAAVNTVAMIAASSTVGSYQKRKAASRARAAFNASLQDRLVMTATAQGARSRVYGRVRNVDGIIWKGTHGDDSEYYTWVVALAGHQVDAIEEVWFNDTPVELDGDGYVTTAPWSNGKVKSASTTATISGGTGSVTLPHTAVGGSVTATRTVSDEINGSQTFAATATVSGAVVSLTSSTDGTYDVYYQYSDTADPVVRVRKYLGGAGQDLSTDLRAIAGVDALIETTDKFRGIAALIVTMRYSQDAFPTGVPNISAVLRGAAVTDPRTSTTAWSENPALIARDWLLYAHGGGLDEDDLVADAWEAAANACDVETDFETPSGTQTRPLYQAGIAIPLDDDTAPDDVLSEIVEAMAGRWCWAGGQVTVRAGVYRSPVATITEDWVTTAGDLTIVPQTATSDLVNIMRPTISDAAQGYVAAPTAEVRSAAFLAVDGDVPWPRAVTLEAVTNAVHAQHVCGVLMREMRDGLTAQLPCNLRAWQLQPLDIVQAQLPSFGWSNKAFEVLGWGFSLTGGVRLTLREVASANYDPDAELDELTSAENTALPDPSIVPQVANLALSSGTTELADGTLVSRVLAEWDAVASAAVQQSGAIEVQYAKAIGAVGELAWIGAAPAPGWATSTVIYGLQAGVHYLVRVRARNTLGVAGLWSYQKAVRVASPRRAVTWYQASEPTAEESQDGDTWFDTDAGYLQYLRVSDAWTAVRDAGIQQGIDAAAAALSVADGKITSHYQETAPSAADNGDIWFDTDDGNKQYVRSGGAWVLAADTRIGTALNAASDAQSTADGKVTTFVATSAPTAEALGDLWIDSDDSNKLYRWSGSAWVSVRDAGIQSALDAAAAAQAAADGKIASYYQATAPGSADDGDIWFDTDDSNKQYVRSGGAWVLAADTRIGDALSAASDAQATADGKVTTFVASSAPTAEAVGDLWIDTDDSNKLYRWSGSAWVSVRDAGIQSALDAAAAAQAAADGKISSFYQDTGPSSADDGDIWFDTDDSNKQYVRSGGAWVLAADTRIGDALSAASDAQATADGKVTTFVATSAPTAEAVGDLWIDTDDSNKLYRWSGSVWVSVRDAGIQSALDAAAAAQSAADGKIASYYQTTAPGSADDGDIWFDTDDSNKQYVRSGGAWVLVADTRIGEALTAASDAQATADGKVTTFVAASAPTAEAVGDLWLDSDDGNKLYRWNGSAWVALQYGTGAIAVGAATSVYDITVEAGPITRTNIS